VAGPSRRQTAAARCFALRPPHPDCHPHHFCQPGQARCRPSRLARAPGRFTHRSADRPGHRQRQAHRYVSTATHP
jgi:hypothetical protein